MYKTPVLLGECLKYTVDFRQRENVYDLYLFKASQDSRQRYDEKL